MSIELHPRNWFYLTLGFIYLPAMLNVLILSAKAAQSPGGKSLLMIFLEGVIFPLYIVYRYQLNFSTSVMIYGNHPFAVKFGWP